MSRGWRALGACAVAAILAATAGACDPAVANEEPVRITVPPGTGSGAIADTLEARGVVTSSALFRLYTRLRGADRSLRPGTYDIPPGIGWDEVVAILVEGRVVTFRITVPEGWSVFEIADGIAAATGVDPDPVREVLADSVRAAEWGIPGPTFEGYLYPATYRFPLGTDPDGMVRAMVDRYRRVWTPERRALADSLGLTEREVVALASIVEKEARVWAERDTIAAVFLNRLEIGMPLQADPTVQYALGEHQTRLLYQHIDDVADHPYNTYRRAGIPPGPIASPSTGSIDAVLNPADVDYLYFVARPDGRHVFTRTFSEHREARAFVRREAEARAREEGGREP